MEHFTSWQAYVSSVTNWLRKLLEAGDIDASSTVWRGDDGSYAVGDDWFYDENWDIEMVSAGSVQEWLDAADQE